MSKGLFIALFLLLCFIFSPQAEAETITLSTYYPAPYGEYDSLTVENLTADNVIYTDGSRVIRQAVVQTNSTNYSTTTTWALGPTFATITGFKAGSLVRLSYHIPMRNDSASWGGGYIEPQISFNGGTTWNSLGSSGYDGGVMHNTSPSIGSYFNCILIDPQQASDFSVRVRFYFRSYNGTVMRNQSHAINTISGTATLLSGVNGTQHYAKIIVEELR
jgi:hypothetical protein